MSTLKDKLKNNMLATIAGSIVLAGSAVAAAESVWGFLDKSVVTEAELAAHASEAHPAALQAVADAAVNSECRWLRSEIRYLKDRIRELEASNADVDWINEKKEELKELERSFRDRSCTTKNYI